MLGVTHNLKLTYNTHIVNITINTYKSLQTIKAQTETAWDKQREMLTALYNAVSLIHMVTSCILYNQQETTQTTAYITATRCTEDTSTQHLQNKILEPQTTRIRKQIKYTTSIKPTTQIQSQTQETNHIQQH